MDAGGIDLIANNNVNPKGVDMSTDVQPLVKGDNVVDCVTDLYDKISRLNGFLSKYVTNQTKFNTAVMKHTHKGFMNFIVRPSENLEIVGKGLNAVMASFFQRELKAEVARIEVDKEAFTSASTGAKYICSYKNHTN